MICKYSKCDKELHCNAISGFCRKHYLKVNNRKYWKKQQLRTKERRARDPEFRKKQNEYSRKRRTTNKCRYAHLKSVAKRKGFTFTLSLEEFVAITSFPCSYCGIIRPENYSGGWLDRLDNLSGYEINNIIPCCVRCNESRGCGFSSEEFKIMMNALIEWRKNNGKIHDNYFDAGYARMRYKTVSRQAKDTPSK